MPAQKRNRLVVDPIRSLVVVVSTKTETQKTASQYSSHTKRMLPANKPSRRSNSQPCCCCLHENRNSEDSKPIFQLSGRNQKDAGNKQTVSSIQSAALLLLSPQNRNSEDSKPIFHLSGRNRKDAGSEPIFQLSGRNQKDAIKNEFVLSSSPQKQKLR